jgi:hypothetical protein
MGSADDWVSVGRSTSKGEVRDQLLDWCRRNGLSAPPAADQVRWYYQRTGAGCYWDVWVRVARVRDRTDP